MKKLPSFAELFIRQLTLAQISQWILILASAQILITFFSYLGPIQGPLIGAQENFLGVSVRYMLRLTGDGFWRAFLMPAALTAGDGLGLWASEFPILQILLAPCFLLGPTAGRACAFLILALLNLALLVQVCKRWQPFWPAKSELKILVALFLVAGISRQAWHQALPDFTALMLMMLAMSFELPRFPIDWRAKPMLIDKRFLLFSCLALLLRPSLIVLTLLWLRWPNKSAHFKSNFLNFVPAIIVALLYHLGVNGIINRITDLTPHAPALLANPLTTLWGLKSDLRPLLSTYCLALFPSGTLLVLLWYRFYQKFYQKLTIVGTLWSWQNPWILLLIQGFLIYLVQGKSSLHHTAIFVALTPTLILIWHDLLIATRPLIVHLLFLGLLSISTLEYGISTLWTHFSDHSAGQIASLAKLLNQHAKTSPTRIRTYSTRTPEIGLYAGKIQNSTRAHYGIFPRMNYDSKELAAHEILARTEEYLLVEFI